MRLASTRETCISKQCRGSLHDAEARPRNEVEEQGGCSARVWVGHYTGYFESGLSFGFQGHRVSSRDRVLCVLACSGLSPPVRKVFPVDEEAAKLSKSPSLREVVTHTPPGDASRDRPG